MFGVGAVLQGLATEGEPVGDRLDPWLLVRLLRRPMFLGALACNLVGLLLHVRALQDLPLFLVQAVISSSVAVTAVRVGAHLRHGAVAHAVGRGGRGRGRARRCSRRPRRRATPCRPRAPRPPLLLAAMVVVAVASVAAGHLHGAPGAVLLGLLAGTGFGIVAVCARLLPGLTPAELVRAPVAYVMAFSGVLAFLLYSSAMQKGSVTVTTAALVVPQTAVPAVIGTLLLGDQVRPGLGPARGRGPAAGPARRGRPGPLRGRSAAPRRAAPARRRRPAPAS